MNFVKLYKAANVNEAYFIKGLLSEPGIKIQLLGEGLSVAIGGLPLEVIEVDILVSKYQFNEAKKIIFDYEKELKSEYKNKNWKCLSCKNNNPDTFDICWNCGNDRIES